MLLGACDTRVGDGGDRGGGELTKITYWLEVNKLSLNAAKTKMMIFHFKQRKLYIHEVPSIKINNIPVERVTQLKFLGVVIDSNLTWSPHQNFIANKLYQGYVEFSLDENTTYQYTY